VPIGRRGAGRATDLDHRPESRRFDNRLGCNARHRANVWEGLEPERWGLRERL
jgi:hypothetical protein